MEDVIKNKNTDGTKTSDNDMVITLTKPVIFEGQEYDKIDLTGLHDIKAADMVEVSRRMSRNGSSYSVAETSLEYALHMANIATGLPLEFFDQLPPYAAMAIRSNVMVFIFRQE